MRSILRVKDASGRVISIPAIRGERPVKGVDYWIDADKAEIVSLTLEALPSVEMVATFDDGSTGTFKLYGEVVTE